MPAPLTRPPKVLFVHTPKAAGLHLIEYFEKELGYPRIQSQRETDDGVWLDFEPEGLREHLDIGGDADADVGSAFLHTHTLAFGWSPLAQLIPTASKDEIVALIREFRANGWFVFTFVRDPGELLCSFYHYVLDAHERGWHAAVALHAPAVDRTLGEFVAEHCERELLPEYWRELDYIGVASDAGFEQFFARYFGHEFAAGRSRSHASGSRGYAHYCASGEISEDTRRRIEASRNMALYREIVGSASGREGEEDLS